MKKLYRIGIIFPIAAIPAFFSYGQKKISEFTIVYNYSVNSGGAQSAQTDQAANAINSIYIKGNMSRSEMTSQLFSSSTIYDAKSGTAVILKEVNGQKLLIRMSAENWQDRNKLYQGIKFTNTAETKTIADYKCQQAVGTTAEGLTITVYYTKELVPENKDYDPQFKTLDGLPLEYELTKGKFKIKYSLASINLNPVPASKFDVPKSGYREMTYEESKKKAM